VIGNAVGVMEICNGGGKSPEMKMPKQPESGGHHDHH
jgi:hypothetical protein